MSRGQLLHCDTHGTVKWNGEVICTGCGAVWHLRGDHQPPPECGQNCTCGKPLVGDEGTARSICPDCYRKKLVGASS
jgi:hypothetical protein